MKRGRKLLDPDEQTMKETIKKDGRMKKWKPENYAKAYALAKSGMKDPAIAKAFGVFLTTLIFWKRRHSGFRECIKLGREEAKGASGVESFGEYVYKRLSPELKDLWDSIHKWEKEKNGIRKIEELLAFKGRRIRQQLFLHALVHCNFNLSEACRKVNIPKFTFDMWVLQDPTFGSLVDEIQWHKGNFFEGALVRLVRDGDGPATVFANRTFNRNRGYNDKVQVEHSGEVNGMGTMVPIELLDSLPLETRKSLLLALREHKKKEPKQIQQVLPDEEVMEDVD